MDVVDPAMRRPYDAPMAAPDAHGRQTEIFTSAANGIDKVAKNLGSSPDPLLARHGLLGGMPGQQSGTMPLKDYTKLLEEVAELTGEDHFGLLFGRDFSMSNLGPHGYLLVHSRTVGEAILRFADHFADFQEASSLKLTISGDLASVSYRIDDPRVKDRQQDAEFTVMVLHSFFRGALGSRWRLRRADFAHPPKSTQWRHSQLLDCDVEFRKASTAFHFDRSLLDLALPWYDPMLLRCLEPYFRERQRWRERDAKLTKRLTILVELALEQGGDPRLEDLADAVGMSARSVHRRLALEGTRFRDIVLACRLEAAKGLLRDTEMPLTAMGVQLGYSDATAFSRAFRKSVGISPLAWRNRCRSRDGC